MGRKKDTDRMHELLQDKILLYQRLGTWELDPHG